MTLNIVQLFEKNPLTRLNKTYESKLITALSDKMRQENIRYFLVQ